MGINSVFKGLIVGLSQRGRIAQPVPSGSDHQLPTYCRRRNMAISTDMKTCDSTFFYLQWKWSGGGRWHWCYAYWV